MEKLTRREREVIRRLDNETPFYAEHAMTIVDKGAHRVHLIPRPAQLKLDAALEAQRDAGRPMRAIVLKSRRTGVSTWVATKMLQRLTRMPNRRAQIVAHDGDTAGELFDIVNRGYMGLPAEIKPPLQHARNTGTDRRLHFGNPSVVARRRGDVGLDSVLEIGTANEVEAARGKTFHDLHISEMAFWKDPRGKDISRKALALMSTVGDEPDTLVVIESTANGSNAFKARWDRAMRGEGSYTPVFIGWLEDPDCSRPFESEERREAFRASIGSGPYGADEPRLLELGATLEQLAWRRVAIVDKCDGKLDLFKQEYPSTPEEAFIASGNHVFSMQFISGVLDRVTVIERREPSRVTLAGPQQGLLLPAGTTVRKTAYSEVEVPTGAAWVPRQATGFDDHKPFWTVWRHPWPGIDAMNDRYARGQITLDELSAAQRIAQEPEGQYILAVDAGGDEESSSGTTAWNAIQVIDHRTGDQVARYASREDTDEFARHALLGGLYFNEAHIAVETTGSWGLPIVRALWKLYGYRFLYRRPQSPDSTREKSQDRLGWDTNRRTKPLIEETLRELLREGTDGIRDRETALELTTYVKLPPRNEHGPDEDAFADRLMSYMIAQYLRTQLPVRPSYPDGTSFSSLTRDLPWA